MLNLVQHLILIGLKPFENLKQVQVDVLPAKVMRIIRFGKWFSVNAYLSFLRKQESILRSVGSVSRFGNLKI
ncbi:hypothetical protein D2V08_03030 [Flagellimonas lutimaris]|uniref:Uncharacterized protein n=1 Tax=Flagellimonas lutimaris TaxID=475082 RepID=A0A3A1NBA1_9FLAO|nr:hypothetical protein D2V08_03030 [Allomuricauda lutimaris]